MGTKKLHSISEVKFSRSSTPFDKDPKPRMICNQLQIIRGFNLRQSFFSLMFARSTLSILLCAVSNHKLLDRKAHH